MVVTNACDPDPRVQRFAKWLAQGGYEVSIYAYDRTEESLEFEEYSGVSIHRLHLGKTAYGGTIKTYFGKKKFNKKVEKKLLNKPSDFIYCHDGDTLLTGIRLKKKTNAKLIFDMHDHHFSWVRMTNPKSILRKIISFAQRVIFESRLKHPDLIITSSASLENGKFPGFKEWLESRGHPSVAIENRPQTSNKRKESISVQPFTISYIGKVRDYDSISLLAEAVVELPEEIDVKLLIAGDGTDSKKVSNLLQNLKHTQGLNYELHGKFGDESKGELISKTSMMYALYNPKRGNILSGAIPTKMFDAASYGIPSIVNSDCLMGELCKSNNWGYEVKWGSKKEITDAILSELKNPKQIEYTSIDLHSILLQSINQLGQNQLNNSNIIE